MPEVHYETVDVFTRSRFRGNQLAVVPDARALTERQMQNIAIEFNYSEVAFVFPPDNAANTARLRIFTPDAEVPFAGHPTIGATFVLGRSGTVFGRRIGASLTFEEGAGVVKARVLHRNRMPAGAALVAPRNLETGHAVDAETVAGCLSLAPADLDLRNHSPTIVSVGLPFVAVEVASLDALRRAKPNVSAFDDASRRFPTAGGDFSLFVYSRVSDPPMRLRARMFAALGRIAEDPATGSAAAALGAFLASLMPAPDMRGHVIIEQGVEMGRRSMLDVKTVKRGGVVLGVSLSGSCVPVTRGVLAY